MLSALHQSVSTLFLSDRQKLHQPAMPSGDSYRQPHFKQPPPPQQQQPRTAAISSDASARATTAANAAADASFAWAVMQDVQASHGGGGGGSSGESRRGQEMSGNGNAATLGEYLQQQERRAATDSFNNAAFHTGYYDLGPATGSSLHAQQDAQTGDSLWARRLKSTNIKLEESLHVSPSKPERQADNTDRPQSASYTNDAGDHNSLEAQQAAMAFITRGALAYSQSVTTAGNASSRQRPVGGWTGDTSNATSTQQSQQPQQQQLNQQQQRELESGIAGLARQRQNSAGSAHTFEEQNLSSSSSDGSSDHPLLRLSPSQMVSSINRPEYSGSGMHNMATAGGSQWNLPNGMPPPSWPGMSPQAYGGNGQHQLSAGFGAGMSAFEHDNSMSGMMDPRYNSQSFSFDSSTLARTDSGSGTLSNSGATTLSTIFDESSPGSSSNANTTPSSNAMSSGPSTGQSLEMSTPESRGSHSNANNGKAVVHSSKAKTTRKEKPRGQQKPQSAQSVSDGFTSSSSNAASEAVESKSRRTSTIDSLGRYVCPHAGCDKTFSTSGHARRHSHTHTTQCPFVCPHEGCDATFSRRDNCTQHQRTRHNHVVEAHRLGAEHAAASPEQSTGAESP